MKRSERSLLTAYLLLAMTFLSAIFAVQGSLLSTVIDAFRLSPGEQGLANSAAFAGGILALIGAFAVQGRWRKRTLLRIAVLICATGLAVMWLAPGHAVYVAAWFIAGFGLGLMDTLLSACMADLYTGRTAVLMMCMLHTAYGLSSVLTPMGYAALLAGGLPWQQVYLVIAACGLVLIGVALIIRRATGMEDREALSAQRMSPGQILPALREGGLLWLTAAIFFQGIALSGLNTWSNRYAELLGAEAIPAQSCVFLGVMLCRLLMPFVPVRAEKYVLHAGWLGGAALALGLLSSNGWVLRGMLMLSSLLFGALIPCVITLACGRRPANTLLATTGIMLALYLGQGLSSPLISALEATAGLRAGMLLCAASLLACSLCCLADARAHGRA